MSRWAQSAEFWRSIPRRSTFIFLAGVFCIFGSFALILSGMNFKAQKLLPTILWVLTSGGFASVWAFIGTRRMIKSMFIVAPLQSLVNTSLEKMYKQAPSLITNPDALQQKLIVDGVAALIMIVLGYILFLRFFQREGARFFKAHTEIRLASEIHRALVPEVSCQIGSFELYGASLPSGEVGGDLLDVVEHDGRWFGYVADVSGHGVPAGVLMGMVKSAARMRLTCTNTTGELLDDLNRVLEPLTPSHAFVTFAYLNGDHGPGLKFSLAGHLPILHYRKALGAVDEHSVLNFPLGLLANQQFEVATLECAPGDLLAIVTDGFTETFDAQERELGLEAVKSILAAAADKPLRQVFAEVRVRASKHGKQTDDQTLLLVRRLS